MDLAALHSCLEIRLVTANTEKLRPALELIEQQLLAALNFGTQSTTPAHPFTILTGHQRHGKKLVSDKVLLALADKHNTSSQHPPLLVVRLSNAFRAAAVRQIAKQILSFMEKQCWGCDQSAKTASLLPTNTSHQLYGQLLDSVSQQHCCLIFVLDDLEPFVQEGAHGVLNTLLKLSEDSRRQVKLLGLTQHLNIRDKLSQHAFTAYCSAKVYAIPRISMTDCPLHQVASVLQVPEEDFGKDAVAWNVAVHSAATALSGSNTPLAMLNAARQGKLHFQHLLLIAQLAMNRAVSRQQLLQHSDISAGILEVLQQAQPLGTLCTALEACMLASAFRHKLKADDRLVMTFESIFTSYQAVASRSLPQTDRCDKNQAWGAFNTLLDMRVLVTDKKCREVPYPPDYRPVRVMIDATEAKAVINTAAIDSKYAKILLRSCF